MKTVEQGDPGALREWVASGMDCQVRQGPMALCGYVRVPDGHPFHGLNWADPAPGRRGKLQLREEGDVGLTGLSALLGGGPSILEWLRTVDGRVTVHGGVTYAGEGAGGKSMRSGWWFGWDAGHAGDFMAGMEEFGGRRWTVEDAAAETERLAAQLARVTARRPRRAELQHERFMSSGAARRRLIRAEVRSRRNQPGKAGK